MPLPKTSALTGKDMTDKFAKEKDLVLQAASKGISGNIPLSGKQKKYIKNLLLFALMNASDNRTVTNRNFIKLVSKIFKGYLIKIIKECLDDDDDTDLDEALDVELNKIIANGEMINLSELEQLLTPENIVKFLKGKTNGLSQRQLLDKLLALRDINSNYRETPQEQRKREQRRREYELQRQRERMMDGRILARGGRER